LIHRKLRRDPDGLTIEEMLDEKTAAQGGYDSDARSVQIESRAVSDDKREQPPQEPSPVRAQNLPPFDWFVPCIDE